MNGRDKRRARAARGRRAEAARSVCPNCGQNGRHFVPPSLGQVGFYACDSFSNARAENLVRIPMPLDHKIHKVDHGGRAG